MDEDDIYSITASFTSPTHALHVGLSALTYLLSTPGSPGWDVEITMTRNASNETRIHATVDMAEFTVRIPGVMQEWADVLERTLTATQNGRSFIAEQVRKESNRDQ